MTGRQSFVTAGRATAARLAGRVGASGYNAQLIASVRHSDWLYRARGGVPSPDLTFRPPAPATETDVDICRRLIAAYHAGAAAHAPAGQTSHIWGGIADTR